MARDERPLVAHVVYRFDTGGLENGVVNLINHMPPEAYRHAVISLTEITDFKKRVVRDDVEFVSLNKAPGHALWLYPELFRLFRTMRPNIVHTRNLAALEVTVPAWAAGVPVRIHGEHGREGCDLDHNSKYHWIRRAYRPFVTNYIALSRDLAHYLTSRVGVRTQSVSQIYNGVDAHRFNVAQVRQAIGGCPFDKDGFWLVGTVGRMQAVKDQMLLARAFVRALEMAPELKSRLRLVMIGDGPLRPQITEAIRSAGVEDLSWLPGERGDIPEILRGLDCFVLPSLSEGISNVILEAMACGLPVIATNVGGNGELVETERTGVLVPVSDVDGLAQAIIDYANNPQQARTAGRQGRLKVERNFSMEAMVQHYQDIYDMQLKRIGSTRRRRGAAGKPV